MAAESAATGVEAEAEQLEDVVVTGSRIRRKDFEATSPTVTAAEELFENTGTIGVETVLNQLPQFVPAATQFSSTTNQATATVTPGASLVNLRGLGSFRTLTLIDGRRATPLNAQLNVDTNSIPSAAIERVEIISGGASAVYGADAVAGVVNFILKDKFQGMDFTARYGLTEEGDGEELQLSGLIGTTFAEGRGNVMMGLEYADRSKAYDVERDWRGRYYGAHRHGGQRNLVGYLRGLRPGAHRRTECTRCRAIPGSHQCHLRCAACLRAADRRCLHQPEPGRQILRQPHPRWHRHALHRRGPFRRSQRQLCAVRQYPLHRWLRRCGSPLPQDHRGQRAAPEQPRRPDHGAAVARFPVRQIRGSEIAENLTVYMRGNFARTETKTEGAYSQAINNWTATIPVGFEGTVWADSLNTNGTTKAAYQTGGAYGLNCPVTGGCTESQAFPMPPELEALLRSRASGLSQCRHQVPSRCGLPAAAQHQQHQHHARHQRRP